MKPMTRLLTLLLAPALLAWTAFAAAPLFAQSEVNGATAELRDAQGQMVGNATLTTDRAGGVRMQVRLSGFTTAAAGEHGIHIHAVGMCEAPEFKTAGGTSTREARSTASTALKATTRGTCRTSP